MEIDEQGSRPDRSRRARIIAAAAGAAVLVGVIAAVVIASPDDDPHGVDVRTATAASETHHRTGGSIIAAIGSARSTVAATTTSTPPPVLAPAAETAPDPDAGNPVASPPTAGAVGAPPVAAAPTVSSPPVTDAPAPKPSGIRVTPHPEAVGPYHTISFDPAGASPDGNGVLVRFWNGNQSCYLLHDVAVTETPSTVTVTLTGGVKAGVEVCTQEAALYEVRVPLSAPLGFRTLASGG